MSKSQPYKSFGEEFKRIRSEAKRTIIDISGAVELEPALIEKIERGEERPSEELIVLIISHFDLDESKAFDLWKLAGYDRLDGSDASASTAESKDNVVPVVVPLSDARIVYTDMVNVTANNYGVVVNFLQGLGSNNQPMAVSRVGMSVEHAVSFMKVLSETVEQVLAQQKTTKGKSLKDSKDSPKKDV